MTSHRNRSTTRTNQRSRTIRLPCFGITIQLGWENAAAEPGYGTIASDLKVPGKSAADRLLNAAIDGLESVILAHACAGIDVLSPAYIEGIETAVSAIEHSFA